MKPPSRIKCGYRNKMFTLESHKFKRATTQVHPIRIDNKDLVRSDKEKAEAVRKALAEALETHYREKGPDSKPSFSFQ